MNEPSVLARPCPPKVGLRVLSRGLLVFALVLTLPRPVAGAEDWRIEAGPIELIPGAPPRVFGYFHVHAPAGTPGDAAPRTGGACLVADLFPFGVGLAACKTNADCNMPESIDKANRPELESYQGYCVVRDGSDEPPRCWTRPGPPHDYCQRSIDGLSLTPGTHPLPTVPADPLNRGAQLPEWAVVACIAEAEHPGDCGVPMSDHRQFSVTPLP